DVPTAARPDDQSFRAGTNRVWKRAAILHHIVPLPGSKLVEVEVGDAGGRVGVDDNRIHLAILMHQADSRKAVPLDEDLVFQCLIFGVADIDDVIANVDDEE